jgi:uncharacterized hydrophobic protein (TIGR00271 family)
MDLTTTEITEAIKSIIANSKLDISYLLINATATIVACSGLMADSTAVIIGSMLIATLLSPIASTALALTDKNKKGILHGLKTLSIGVALVIAIAFCYGLLFPHIQATQRMLARTDPGIFDFIIAFFGGLAGAIALLFKRYNAVMVGVGIATALVPPLSTAGIFFAKANYNLGSKALELALINITFIMVANFIVFKYFKLTSKLNE